MFCINCGKQLPEEARFCAYCGKALIQKNNDVDDFKGITIEVVQPTYELINDPQKEVGHVDDLNFDTPEGAYLLANKFETGGDGFDRNLRKAFDLYVKSSKAGYDKAQFRLACAYKNGELNLKENYEKAYDWYLKAANNGNVEAMYKAGDMYYWMAREIADETEDDDDEEFAVTDEEIECMKNAKMWFEKAADCGNGQAARMLRQYFSR